MIESGEELLNYFWFCGMRRGIHKVNVSSKVRKDVMTGNRQNKTATNGGRVVEIIWKNLGGGVWEASVEVA